MSESDAKYSLRQEARPIPYWKHHKRAKAALDFIIRGLEAAVNSVEAGKDDKKHSVDTNRASRIIFVSGEPGSGKSSLYLTLKETLSSPQDKEYRKGITIPEKVEKVRWLDALDLEVASEEGENLLAAVLVRLINELTREDRVPQTIHSQPCGDAIKELEELATDIGIAWEGNLRARAGELDPDTYSEEVMRAQRARLGINDRLRKALDGLAENRCYGCHNETLFVLPVDDLYLKPDISLELLRLLRMISIPRLFFLIMGDIKTVEALFIEKSLADWTEVAGTRLFASRSERLDAAITRARELRARYLRKLLPPLQRTMIEPMDWHEALDFESGGSNSSDKSLEELLAEVRLDKPYRTPEEETTTLLNFLISPHMPDAPKRSEERDKRRKRAQGVENVEPESEDELELKKIRSAYTALQILDATPREMMDLGAALREALRKAKESKPVDDKTPVLLITVRDIVDLVREEQSFLSEKEQEALESILPTRQYGYPEDIIFEIDRLCLHPSQRKWEEKKSASIWIRDHRSWNLTVPLDLGNGIDKAAKDQFAKLPPRPAAWFTLLHDLAWKWNPDSLTVNLIGRMCDELNDWQLLKSKITIQPNQETCLQSKQRSNSKAEPNLDPSSYLLGGWAIWFDESISTYKHFPLPPFELFRDIDRFLFIWSRGLAWLEQQRKQADETEKTAVAAEGKARSARTRAEEAKAEVVKGGNDTEAVKAQKQAEASAVQKEAEAAAARRQANEAQERAGANESQRISMLIRLWGLAGSTILNEQYDEFKPSDNNWFEQGLRNFATGIDKTKASEDWRKKMEDFRSEVIPK